MDHRDTFTGKQLKKKLLEKQIFGESSHDLFWSLALWSPHSKFPKQLIQIKITLKKSIVLPKMQEERLISNLINEHFASLKVS